MDAQAPRPPHSDESLDEDTLQAMIADGEKLNVEFKGESKPGLTDADIAEAVVGLANKGGNQPGWLLLGVEDDRTLSTSRNWGQGKSPRQIQAIIERRTQPPVQALVQEFRINQHTVTVIRVPPASVPVCTSKGRFVRRTFGNDGKPASQSLNFNQIQSIRAAAGELDFSELVADGVKLADLNPLEFERFRQRVKEHPESAEQSLLQKNDEDLCRALKAVEYESGLPKVRMLGVLLFGHEEMIEDLVPSHRVAYQVASHKGVHANEIRHWPLIRAMDELENVLLQTRHEDEIIFGTQRVGLPECHPTAVREAVANALAHRDYFQRGTVRVRWLDRVLDVSSPGGFPADVGLTSFLVNGSRPRNHLLLRALQRGGVVEEVGRGVRTIFQLQLLAGRPRPAYLPNATDHVILSFDHAAPDLRLVRLARHEGLDSESKPLDILLILHDLLHRETIDLPRAAIVTQRTEGHALTVMDKLVQRQLLSRTRRNPPSWKISPRALKICNNPLPLESARFVTSPPVSQNINDDAENASLILAYVTAHGRITRREVIDLCRLGPKTATRVLQRLTQSGILVSHGSTRRDTWYSIPETDPESTSRSTCEHVNDDAENISVILAHVTAHGGITKQEAINLCQSSSRVVTRILKHLIQSGDLVRHGRTRDTWYSLPEASA